MANRYAVTAAMGLAVPPRVPVRLTDQQLVPRRHQVAALADKRGFYVSRERLTFRLGEVVEVEGELPLDQAQLLPARKRK